MLAYLSSEIAFVRAYSNRTLLIIFLCALTRTAEKPASASAFGLSINLNPGIIVVYGPLLVLLLLTGLSMESDALLKAREVVLDEASKAPLKVRSVNRNIYALFWMPAIASFFLLYQYYINVVPNDPIACGYDRLRNFFDLAHLQGTPSLYCIRNLSEGMPWIYPPFQIYLCIAVVFACAFVTLRITRDWEKARGAPPQRKA